MESGHGFDSNEEEPEALCSVSSVSAHVLSREKDRAGGGEAVCKSRGHLKLLRTVAKNKF